MKIIKKLAPQFIHSWYMIWQTFGYDIKLNKKFSFSHNKSLSNIRGLTLMIVHSIEKGLTMPDSRPGFGTEKILNICALIELYVQKNGKKCFEMSYDGSILSEYKKYHEKLNYQLKESVLNSILKANDIYKSALEEIDQLKYSELDFFSKTNDSFDKFSSSRHSIRDYNPGKPIPIQELKDAVQIAQNAPSSCNRQPCKIYIINNISKAREVLSCQGHCQGFGHLATTAIIITTDLRYFSDTMERVQPSVNAGFFGMSLLYALHFKKIGACVLNWSNTKKRDKDLRKIIDIPEYEQINFLISCGYTSEKFKVALSKRKSVEELMTII